MQHANGPLCLRPCHLVWAIVSLSIACGDDGAPAGEDEGSGGATTMATGTTTQPVDSTGASDTGSSDGSATVADTSGSGDETGSVGYDCIDLPYVNGGHPGADYSMFADVPLGSHCQGTNQQDITEIERIVFLGDSVTVGTPPSGANQFFRNIVAEGLAEKFELEPPVTGWQNANTLSGTAGLMESGAFASCAHYGDQNNDLLGQLEQCFPPEDRTQRTLVVFTMGGNDASVIAQAHLAGESPAETLARVDAMVAAHDDAVKWLVEPGKFENGVFVVNSNVYEFTDLTFDFLSCPTAALAGFNSAAEMPEILLGGLKKINQEYMRTAQAYGTDVVFMSEGFCGHGFQADDEAIACYRGPDTATWFDVSCIHPTPAGHAALADMFLNVISE